MAKRKTPAPTRATRPAPAPGPDDRFVVAYVHPGQTSAYFTHSLTGMVVRETLRRTLSNVIQEWSSANISDSRNELVRRFLDQRDANWLLFIDADMAFAAESFEALRAAAHPADRPIVGGLCFGSSNGRLFPTIYQFVQTEDGITTMRRDDVPVDTMLPVGATGAAFLLIHRSALEAMRAREFNVTFPWFQETELGGRPAGEDITFCIRAGICGLPIFVHTGVRVGHHKSTLLTLEEFDRQREGDARDG